MLHAIIDATAHENMSSQALNLAKVREGLCGVLSGPDHLYEELRKEIHQPIRPYR